MIKCCMFDLDGTLLNTLLTITYYVNKTLQKYNIFPINEDECKSFVGNGARKLIHRALAARGAMDEREGDIYNDYLYLYDTDPYYLTEPYEEIPELIAELSKRGIACAVISNKQNSATVAAISHFFGDMFVSVRGAVDGLPLKPDPELALLMLDKLGISPSETVYIGDTGVDMQTGRNIGAHTTVGVSWGFRDRAELEAEGADIIIDRPSELLDLKFN